jgi:hypothetical protein
LEAGAGNQNAVVVVRRYAGLVVVAGLVLLFPTSPMMKMTTK